MWHVGAVACLTLHALELTIWQDTWCTAHVVSRIFSHSHVCCTSHFYYIRCGVWIVGETIDTCTAAPFSWNALLSSMESQYKTGLWNLRNMVSNNGCIRRLLIAIISQSIVTLRVSCRHSDHTSFLTLSPVDSPILCESLLVRCC